MKKLKIKDIVVIALAKKGKLPMGEACNEDGDYSEMSSTDRVKMMDRLFYKINILMEEAEQTYRVNCKKPDSEEINPDFMTRLSTNEFFFYTLAPLTLKEFEYLMNKIAEKAVELPVGIQLVLGSFAVKTADNRVMNVTPHISLGQPPSFTFLIKNYTSPIDVRYKERDLRGDIKTLKVFDSDHRTASDFPKIDIQGTSHLFTFNNVIACKTQGGESFLTAVDICLDHYWGVAKKNVSEFLNKEPKLLKQPISQMVISNETTLQPRNCFNSVVHVDPLNSLPLYGKYPTQMLRKMDNTPIRLARDDIEILHLDHHVYPTLEEKVELEFLEKLSIGVEDKLMNEFITEKKHALTATNITQEKQAILIEINKISEALEGNEAFKEITTIIADFRNNAGFFTVGMNRKAHKIESALKKASIEDRCHLLQSDVFKKDIVEALASHRHIGNLTKLYTGATSKTYKDFKLKFFREETAEQLEKTENTEFDTSLKK